MNNNYRRMLQLLEGIKQPVPIPLGSAGFYTDIKRSELGLNFAAKLNGQVHRARMSLTLTADQQIKILDLVGTQPLIDLENANPLSGQGVSSFLVNTLINTLSNVLPETAIITGRLKAPQSLVLEPLAARRNFWRRFGFDIESWGEGRERVICELGNLETYPERLLGSELTRGLDLMHQHLID